jgi:hypothetical protein
LLVLRLPPQVLQVFKAFHKYEVCRFFVGL